MNVPLCAQATFGRPIHESGSTSNTFHMTHCHLKTKNIYLATLIHHFNMRQQTKTQPGVGPNVHYID